MANSSQARKRARQNDVRRAHNRSYRSTVRTSIKTLLNLIKEDDAKGAQIAYRDASALIDKGANKGLHHKNRAARLKSRLNKRLLAIAA